MERTPKFDYSDIHWKENGKLKLCIVVGTRPEIIRLAAVITKCRQYFDVILAHTGQNYDYNLNGIFFRDLKLAEPEVYMDAVGDDLGATCGNIINCSYKLFAQTKPDAVLVLGDTNSCLSVIGAKRLHIPIFHMEAGNRCKDECLPEETNRRIVDIISDVNLAYSEHARRYLAECGLPKERTYVTGSPMAEVLHQNLAEIEASDIHKRLGLEKGKYILLSAHREENIDTEKNFLSLFNAINKLAEKYDMPILYSCHPRSRNRLASSGFKLDPRVIQHEPLGFHDYNCLQMNAFAVVSDSGTLPEESSFFTSVGHPFPAICIRTSTERPEALDKACFILAGIDERSLLQAVDTAVDMNRAGDFGLPVPTYTDENVSTKVVKIIQSYTGIVNGVQKQWLSFSLDDPRSATGKREVSYGKPMMICNLNNAFRLPTKNEDGKGAWQLELNSELMSACHFGNAEIKNWSWNLSCAIQKSFLRHDALTLRLVVSDIFHKTYNNVAIDLGNHILTQTHILGQERNCYDFQRLTLTARYSFNAMGKTRYKGKGAGKSFIERM